MAAVSTQLRDGRVGKIQRRSGCGRRRDTFRESTLGPDAAVHQPWQPPRGGCVGIGRQLTPDTMNSSEAVELSKPVIAIVGAGAGVSAGIARKFGRNGFAVVLLARTRASLDRQVAELEVRGVDAHGLVADASDKGSLAEAFALLEENFGVPEVLVYNAGANTISNPSVLAEEDLISDFTVNVVGALSCSRLVIPQMAERGSGTILFTGGMLGLKPVASRTSASISKAGLRNLAFTLSDELAPLGLKVGTVTIGGVVKPGTFFDPDLIAESYWELFTGARHGEILYQPAPESAH